jgi:hypothetical protein
VAPKETTQETKEDEQETKARQETKGEQPESAIDLFFLFLFGRE